MLSRSICVKRICRSCCPGIAQRQIQRHLASGDLSRRWNSNDAFEALLSARREEQAPKTTQRKGKRQAFADTASGWELAEEEATSTADPPEALSPGSTEAPKEVPEPPVAQSSEKLDDRPPEPSKPPISWDPLSKHRSHVSKGAKNLYRTKYLHQESMGLKALGEDLSAIIMNNPDTLRRPFEPIVMPKDAPEEPLDWDQLLEAETPADADAEDISRNIEAMRPRHSPVLSSREYDALAKKVNDAFLSEQLVRYITPRKESMTDFGSINVSFPWMKSLSRWTPMGDRTTHQSPKRRLVHDIMTKLWGLQRQEEVDKLGSCLVELKPEAYSLITHPTLGVIDILRVNTLEAGEGLTAQSGSIRLMARKSSVRAVLSVIDQAISSRKSRKISIQHIRRALLGSDVLNELSRITKTKIVHDASAKEIEVTWLDMEENASGVEDRADLVARLLQSPSAFAGEEQVVSRRFRVHADKMADVGKFVPYSQGRSLAWRDRMRSWSRLVLPTAVADKKRFLKLDERIELPAPKVKDFKDGATNKMSATFGHIIHSEEGEARKKDDRRRRALAPVMPHPAAFSSVEGSEEPASSSAVVITLAGQPGTHAPDLRLTLPDGNIEQATLKCIQPWFLKDVMIPDDVVDLRLVQQREFEIDMSEQAALQEFLQASDPEQLLAPSSTSIILPHRLAPKATAEHATPYTLSSIESVHTVSLAWKSHTLQYTSSTSTFNGEKQELSIIADVGEVGTEFEEPSKAWLALLDQAVSGKFWDWNNGSDYVKELPEEGGEEWNEWLESEMARDNETSEYEIDGAAETDDVPLETLADEEDTAVIDEAVSDHHALGETSTLVMPSDDVATSGNEALERGQKLSEEVEEALQLHQLMRGGQEDAASK
ncbi:mitochondrial inner-membrane-bound regulator-domain-containing protein [Emericellopsis atlantica]|uniref:Mitochondrial inner-membrane-bound regulator-domain-containing protein n=1 Tax=Emericellopsis atlantica TaxID=2614577 RepID=A0A9P7ZVL1_9HYPO|nr:mitochondrial inner-membrane-bound regulator-domain-containing protein [Emericellopsis atlantica]KAG9258636.1 mitochondrial inner-membrane-bound regulator-domain-containing protein [Emericellopsis atlantica]